MSELLWQKFLKLKLKREKKTENKMEKKRWNFSIMSIIATKYAHTFNGYLKVSNSFYYVNEYFMHILMSATRIKCRKPYH